MPGGRLSAAAIGSSLTRREREIAGLIAEGFSNREIAGRLYIAPRTVEGHVERIFDKLGFNNRSQVAAWVVRGSSVGAPGQYAARESRGNLPNPATTYVGHALEVKELAAELPSRRLMTLTGPGGVGKTRMSIEAAARSAVEYPNGIWFVELGSVVTEAAASLTVATVIGAPTHSEITVEESIVDFLRGQHLMLIVDNCEHLIEPVRRLISRVAESCDTVTTLVTSREPLGVAGERVHPVVPLDPSLEGVALFCDRAEAADSSVAFDEEDLAAIRRICEQLDGVPLAIELAAAHSRSMTPSDMVNRLDDRFRLLRGRTGSGVERHQTMWMTVDWSYQLLNAMQRELFDRLSVFAGEFDLEAAEAVCTSETIGSSDMLDLLAELVDKSMLTAVRGGTTMRYRLLETLRSYGEVRLAERGDPARLREAHARHYALLAARTTDLFAGSDQLRGVDIFERTWDNLRAALAWASSSGDIDSVVTIVMSTTWYSFIYLRHEHQGWMEQALNCLPANHPDRPLLLAQYALFLCQQDDPELVIELARQSLTAATENDHSRCVNRMRELLPNSAFFAGTVADSAQWLAHLALGVAYLNSGRGAEAMEAGKEAETLAAGDTLRLGLVWGIMVWIASGSDPSLVPHYAALSRRFSEQWRAPSFLAGAAFGDGMSLLLAGDGSRAIESFQESLRFAEGPRSMMRGQALQGLAWAASLLDQADAAKAFRDAISELYTSRFWQYIWIVAETLGAYWAEAGQLEPAAVVVGHLEAHNHAHSTLTAVRQSALNRLTAAPATSDAMTRGARMDRDELIAYVLAELDRAADRSVGDETDSEHQPASS